MNDSLGEIAENSSQLGIVFLRSKQYDKALKCFNDAIEFNPNKVQFLCNRILCYMEMWKYKEAIDDTVTLMKLDKNSVIGLEMQVKCHIAFGALLEANVCLTIFVNVRGDCEFVDYHKKLVTNLLSLTEQYKNCVRLNQHLIALNAVNELLKHVTHNLTYKLAKAQILCALQMFLDAEIVAKEILAVHPRNDAAIAIVKYAEHCVYALRAKVCEPEIPEVVMEDVQENISAGESKQDVKHFVLEKKKFIESEIKKERESQIQTFKIKATIAFKEQNYRSCYELYTYALRIDPSNDAENAKIHFNLSIVASKLEKTHEAIDNCTKAIKLEPKYLKAYLRRAKLYFNERCFDEAVNDYGIVVQMEPKNEEYSELLKQAKLYCKLSNQCTKYKKSSALPIDERFLDTGASFLDLTAAKN